ncbi:MAG: hypothetical protein ACE5JI_11980 [Acidobacteriota bacterium]
MWAQEGETWLTQEKVWNVTAIKIHPNAGEQYLNNLRKTWVSGIKAAMKEGLVTDYRILTSLTPNDGSYNLLLITVSPNLASMDATDALREKFERIEQEVEKIISEQEVEKITATVYPEVRTILSEKLLREIKFIDKQ